MFVFLLVSDRLYHAGSVQMLMTHHLISIQYRKEEISMHYLSSAFAYCVLLGLLLNSGLFLYMMSLVGSVLHKMNRFDICVC